MASGGDIATAFKLFCKNGEAATSKDMTKWFTDAGAFGKKCCSNDLDIQFSKVKTKGKNTITLAQAKDLVGLMAKSYADDKKLDAEAAKAKLIEKLSGATPKGHGTTGTSKTGGVSKMTDASKYTGSHKERFDASGKGKGIEGRSDKADNTGYVGAYKGQGSYDKK